MRVKIATRWTRYLARGFLGLARYMSLWYYGSTDKSADKTAAGRVNFLRSSKLFLVLLFPARYSARYSARYFAIIRQRLTLNPACAIVARVLAYATARGGLFDARE